MVEERPPTVGERPAVGEWWWLTSSDERCVAYYKHDIIKKRRFVAGRVDAVNAGGYTVRQDDGRIVTAARESLLHRIRQPQVEAAGFLYMLLWEKRVVIHRWRGASSVVVVARMSTAMLP
jgi:hypothetical protein